MTRQSMRLRRSDDGAVLRPPSGATEFHGALRAEHVYTLPPLGAEETFLQSETVGYDAVRVTFDPAEVVLDNPYSTYGGPSAYAIVRSPAGTPTTVLDGFRVATYDFAGGATPLADGQRAIVLDTPLKPGRFYYYALFARYEYTSNTYWLRVAQSEVLVPYDFGYKTKVWNLIPEYYRRLDDEGKGSAQEGVLRRFLNAIGYETDIQRTWVLTVGDLWDTSRLNSRLLPHLGGVLGLPAETVVGDKRYRKLLANIMYLRKLKGTKDGIEGWLSAATGYRTIVYVGKNIFLSNDDTEMRTSLGLWESAVTNIDATRITSAGEASGPAAGEHYLRLTNSTGGSATADLRYGPATFDRTRAIPVVAGNDYRSSVKLIDSESSKSVVPTFDWYEADGTLISTTTDSPLSTSTSWAQYDSAWVTAPAGAAFCVPHWTSASMSNAATIGFWKAMLVDRAWQPEGIPSMFGDPSTDYESARKVWVSLYPQRTNFAINSDFQADGYGWSASDPTTYELLPVAYATYADVVIGESTYADLLAGYDSLVTETSLTFDTVNGWLVIDTAGTASPWLTQTSSDFFPVISEAPYSVKLDAMSASGAGTKLLLRIKWYTDDISSAEIGTPASSMLFTLSTSDWTTCTLGNATPPEGAVFGRVIIETSNTSGDHTDRIRKVLIEDAPLPGPYFDGSFTEAAYGDYRFTGADWQSFSAYHLNFEAILNGVAASGRADTLAADLVPPDRDVGINNILNGLLG